MLSSLFRTNDHILTRMLLVLVKNADRIAVENLAYCIVVLVIGFTLTYSVYHKFKSRKGTSNPIGFIL